MRGKYGGPSQMHRPRVRFEVGRGGRDKSNVRKGIKKQTEFFDACREFRNDAAARAAARVAVIADGATGHMRLDEDEPL